jgi:hypothetical protein
VPHYGFVTTTYLATPQSELARAVHAHTICLRFKHHDTNDCIEVIYGSHRPSICVWARASRADLRTETELYALSRTSALLTDTAQSQTIGHGKGEGKGGLQSSLRTCACGLEIWRMQEHRGATITKLKRVPTNRVKFNVLRSACPHTLAASPPNCRECMQTDLLQHPGANAVEVSCRPRHPTR